MTNKQIHTALIKPNAEIVVIPSDLERRSKLCLRANGISAKKKKNNIITVLESNHSQIPIGSVILFINGIYSDFLEEALLIPIGTVVVKIDSLLVDQLSNDAIIKYLQQPNDAIIK